MKEKIQSSYMRVLLAFLILIAEVIVLFFSLNQNFEIDLTFYKFSIKTKKFLVSILLCLSVIFN